MLNDENVKKNNHFDYNIGIVKCNANVFMFY